MACDKRPSSAERGYGPEHKRARTDAIRKHRSDDPCARCGDPLGEDTSRLDLDHTDDRTGYLGLSHSACNRSSRPHGPRGKWMHVCDTCGLGFSSRYAAQRFCSVPCRRAKPRVVKQKRVKSKPVVMRPCAICWVLTPSVGGSCCSNECRVEKNRRLQRDKYRARVGLAHDPDEPTGVWIRMGKALSSHPALPIDLLRVA